MLSSVRARVTNLEAQGSIGAPSTAPTSNMDRTHPKVMQEEKCHSTDADTRLEPVHHVLLFSYTAVLSKNTTGSATP